MKSSDGETQRSSDQLRPGVRLPWAFWTITATIAGAYAILIAGMLLADLQYTSWSDLRDILADPRVRYSITLSLLSCTISAILAMWVAVPAGYLLARSNGDVIARHFARRPWLARLLRAARFSASILFDVPIVLPPLVVGISLLILFQTSGGRWIDKQFADWMAWIGFPGIRGITYEIPAVILAQFTVATAFAIRVMHATFQQIDVELEQTALTLGATRTESFVHITLPQAMPGIVSALTLAWARSLGEFGPILIFAGTARMKTEVLSTTVYLQFSQGNLRAAVAASFVMLSLAVIVLLATRSATHWIRLTAPGLR